MNVLADAVVSLVLLAFGYIEVCNYLQDKKWNYYDKELLRINRNRAIYLITGSVIAALLIVLFQLVYQQPFLTQIKLLILVQFILPCAATDYKTHKIPNLFILCALAIRVVIYIAEFLVSVDTALNTLKDNLLGAAIIAGFFLIILLIFKNSIGMGDVKLFAIMGLYQGLWGAVNSVFFSLIVSFFVSIVLLITKKKGRKDVISFGPSILIGTVIAIAISGM